MDYPESRRILQIFDPVAQRAYKNWSAKDKLMWLEDVLKMYWAGLGQITPIQPERVRDKDKNV
ncbi:MAG: hypothetical protein A2992_03850 [Elusimicrobia bacterium RIFCSPLOWO2_01_FULL_59_12]|nr:MAG: hypothetical protein A2992_03850 [Elusimicrobia bacterium RIFCSPLOWO2_01_FULL_59_12]